jgi:hypothetical protein
VALSGRAVAGAPRLTLPTRTLDFGNVPVGMPKTLPFEIKNTGNVLLTINKAKAPAGVFSTSSPISEGQPIPPGGSVYQTVTFTPAAVGRVAGDQYFYLLTGDDGQGPQLVELSGTGVSDPIAVKFEQMGGASAFSKNPLGQAVTGEYALAGGTGQDFVNGSLYWSQATGAHAVMGAIRTEYTGLGGPAGALGYPVTDELVTPDGVGRFNHFSRGSSIYWSPATGAHAVGGAIRGKWAALGWETGLGYPVTDELVTPDRVGRFNHFSRGSSIYWSPATGAHAVGGAIRSKWAALGWETGLGYPVTDEYAATGGRRQDFRRGRLTWNARTGVVTRS